MKANPNVEHALEAIEAHIFNEQVLEWFTWHVEKQFDHRLTESQLSVVIEGFKDYFAFIILSPAKVAIPSKLVDELWHAFILHTAEYQKLAEKMGMFIHHYPIMVKRIMGQNTTLEGIEYNEHYQSIIRAYCLACQASDLDPLTTDEVPFLFRIDSILPNEHASLFDIKFFQSVIPKLGSHHFILEE
ncbi:hypothetical protein ACFOEE_00260 [Pseudoalteromonas fenneropenaei]|uniref:Uncharacterized protein n=1 Tax=Pseudoalteromonas fenneropenaei TaxID=1737459 RepID=A0ABV7CEI9_9GAMM